MKTIIRHGEVILYPINKIPKEAELQQEVIETIVAHSETGHNHLLTIKDKIDMSKIKVFTWNGETYLDVPQISELWHQKTGKDVHKAHRVVPSAYKVVIKKEYDYYKGIIRQVRD